MPTVENRVLVTEDCGSVSTNSLVQRLVREHRRWRSKDFPLIAHLFDEIQHTHGAEAPYVAPLRKAFYQLYAEMEAHMTREEHVLFPAILEAQAVSEKTGQSFGSIRNPIAMAEQEHDWEAERLAKMRNIAGNYRLPKDAPEKLCLLFRELQALETALRAHTFLESSVLFAQALHTEKKARPAA